MSDESRTPYPNQQRHDEAISNLEKAVKSRDRREKAAPLGVIFATLAVLAVLVGGIFFLATYDGSKSEDQAKDQNSESETPQGAPLPDGPKQPYGQTVKCEYPPKQGEDSHGVQPPENGEVQTSGTTTVNIETTQGSIPVKVDASKSPCTANSFTHLAKANFFDNSVCHRHVKSPQMGILQCGDPTGTGSGGPGYSFKDEFPSNGVDDQQKEQPMTYPRGTLAMANSGPDSNGSQFFLVTKDTQLPPKYNVFGTIDEAGLKTLDSIYDKAPDGDNKPADEVKITSTKTA